MGERVHTQVAECLGKSHAFSQTRTAVPIADRQSVHRSSHPDGSTALAERCRTGQERFKSRNAVSQEMYLSAAKLQHRACDKQMSTKNNEEQSCSSSALRRARQR